MKINYVLGTALLSILSTFPVMSASIVKVKGKKVLIKLDRNERFDRGESISFTNEYGEVTGEAIFKAQRRNIALTYLKRGVANKGDEAQAKDSSDDYQSSYASFDSFKESNDSFLKLGVSLKYESLKPTGLELITSGMKIEEELEDTESYYGLELGFPIEFFADSMVSTTSTPSVFYARKDDTPGEKNLKTVLIPRISQNLNLNISFNSTFKLQPYIGASVGLSEFKSKANTGSYESSLETRALAGLNFCFNNFGLNVQYAKASQKLKSEYSGFSPSDDLILKNNNISAGFIVNF